MATVVDVGVILKDYSRDVLPHSKIETYKDLPSDCQIIRIKDIITEKTYALRLDWYVLASDPEYLRGNLKRLTKQIIQERGEWITANYKKMYSPKIHYCWTDEYVHTPSVTSETFKGTGPIKKSKSDYKENKDFGTF